jgi:chromosome segregation ATPase
MRRVRRYLCGASMFVIVAGLVGGAAGQTARPAATLDDLVTEVSGLRGDINHMLGASIRAQLLTTRLSLQEQRIRMLAGQWAESQRKLTSIEGDRGARAEHVKQLESLHREGTAQHSQIRDLDEMLAGLRQELARSGFEEQALRAEEQELRRAMSAEQNAWIAFSARLNELELALTESRQPASSPPAALPHR